MPDPMLASVCCRGPLDLFAVQLLQDLSCMCLAHHELKSISLLLLLLTAAAMMLLLVSA